MTEIITDTGGMGKRSLILIPLFVLLGLIGVIPASAQSYGPDITSTGAAFDCGHNGASVSANAFDDNNTTVWVSSQTGAAVYLAACIGQDFSSATHEIRQMRILQSSNANYRITSALVQNSSDGVAYNTVMTLTLPDDGIVHTYAIDASANYRYWRLLANASPVNNWGNFEIEMMEAMSWPTDTPGPTNTPTITLTPSTTPSPTLTPTPDILIIATDPNGNFIGVKPWGDFGQISLVGFSAVIALILFIQLLVTVGNQRRAK